nr:Sec-independent protein translocase protein TatB [uncultured Rhodopila sp.]
MFDFAWSEILLIGVVALIAIGPKDMPAAIRTVSRAVKKARRMAAEFQTHVDEMVREADLGDVRKTFNEIRNFDIPGALEKHIDPDRSLSRTFAEDPFKPAYPVPGEVSTLDEVAVAAQALPEALPAPVVVEQPPKPDAPAFIPPGMVPPPPPVIEAAHAAAEAPAFIPPGAIRP